MTSAPETPGTPPAAADRSRLEGVIRDLYSLVAFYLANPGHPLPQSIQVHHWVDSRAAVQAVADVYASGAVYGDARPQTDHFLPQTSIPVALLTAHPLDPERAL